MGFLDSLQSLVDQHIFPPSGPEYPDQGGQSPRPPSYGSSVPTFEGSDHHIDPATGAVGPAPPDPQDNHPDAEPQPYISKAQAKDLTPFRNRILELASGYGEDPAHGGHMIAPGTHEFMNKIGLNPGANGISHPYLYNMPGVGPIATAFSPDAQSLLRKQDAANKFYSLMLDAKAKEVTTAPSNIRQAQQLGIPVPYNSEQLGNQIEAPRGSLGLQQHGLAPNEQGPQPGIVDPDQQLDLPQQILAGEYTKGLASGNTMATPGGVVPSYVAAMGPRIVPHDQIQDMVNSVLPPDENGQPQMTVPPGIYPTAAADAMFSAAKDRATKTNPMLADQGNDRESIARSVSKEFTGKLQNYNQLMNSRPDLGKIVDQRYQDLQLKLAAARQSGQIGANMAAPMDNLKQADLFDKAHFDNTGQLIPLQPDRKDGAISEGYGRAKGLQVSDKDREQLYGVDQAGSNLMSIFDQANRLITAKDPVGALGQAAKIYAASNPVARTLLEMTDPGYDTGGAATYMNTLKALSNNLAKAFGGERGVLTNVDVQRWVDAMPKPTDTADIREQKQTLLNRLYGEAKRAQLRAIRGDIPVTDIRKQLSTVTGGIFKQMEGLSQAGPQPSSLGKLSPDEISYAKEQVANGVPKDELGRMLLLRRQQAK